MKITLSGEFEKKLEEQAVKRGISVTALVKSILYDWLTKEEKHA